eukprot:scaffold2015_cov186-Amphora_coffeaeformis.AAC.9
MQPMFHSRNLLHEDVKLTPKHDLIWKRVTLRLRNTRRIEREKQRQEHWVYIADADHLLGGCRGCGTMLNGACTAPTVLLVPSALYRRDACCRVPDNPKQALRKSRNSQDSLLIKARNSTCRCRRTMTVYLNQRTAIWHT